MYYELPVRCRGRPCFSILRVLERSSFKIRPPNLGYVLRASRRTHPAQLRKLLWTKHGFREESRSYGNFSKFRGPSCYPGNGSVLNGIPYSVRSVVDKTCSSISVLLTKGGFPLKDEVSRRLSKRRTPRQRRSIISYGNCGIESKLA